MSGYSTLITLILVMNPFGNIPIFVSILSHVDKEKRTKVLIRESLIALIFLAIFLFFGPALLKTLNLNYASMNVAGGIILFLIAIRMIFPSKDGQGAQPDSDPFIVPIAMPMIAGPSSLALVMLIGTQGEAHGVHYPFVAVLVAWMVNTIILISGLFLSKHISPRGLTALERLMGMLLTTIAVQMFLSGVASFYNITLQAL